MKETGAEGYQFKWCMLRQKSGLLTSVTDKITMKNFKL